MCDRLRDFHRLGLAAVMVCLATSASSLAQEADSAVRWQLQDVPGREMRLQREQSTKQFLTIGEGNIESHSSSFAVVVRQYGERQSDGSLAFVDRHEVLQSNISVAGTSYEFDSANPDVEPGEAGLRPLAELWRAVFRTPVTVTLDRDGQVKSASVPPEALAALDNNYRELLESPRLLAAVRQERSQLPTSPLGVGQKWEASVETPLGSGQVLTVRTEYEFTGEVTVNGKVLRRAVSRPVSVTYSMDPNSPSPLKVSRSELTAKATEGELLFDAARGQIVKEQQNLKVTGQLTFQINGNEVPGKVEFEITGLQQLQASAAQNP